MSTSRWHLLANRDFRLLLITRLSVATGLLIQSVIVGWQVYQLTSSALLLGLIGLTEAIPAIGCSFISGHLVDNHRPAIIYRLSLFISFLNALLLFAAVTPALSLSTEIRLTLLFTSVFISGAARSFNNPATFALTANMIPRAQLRTASAWNSMAYQLASIIGPAAGGLAYGEFGAQVAFALPAFFQLMASLSITLISAQTRDIVSESKREPFILSVASGLKFTFGHRVLLSTMTLDMFSVFFGGAVAVLPIYADQILHVGSQGLGFLRAAPSVGSGLVALLMALFPNRIPISGRVLMLVVAGFGLTTLGFAVSTSFYLSLFFLAATGAFDGVSMVIRGTILQLFTPNDMRGRVSSVSSVFITSSNEIGAFESGVAARLMGLVPSVVFGGVMTLIVVGATWLVVPELAKTDVSQES